MKVFASFVLFVLIVAIAPNAHAVKGDPWINDPPCPDLDCATQADNGGVAGGMISCIALEFCVDCGETPTGAKICVKAYRNAACKCRYGSKNGERTCQGEGACTYRGQR